MWHGVSAGTDVRSLGLIQSFTGMDWGSRKGRWQLQGCLVNWWQSQANNSNLLTPGQNSVHGATAKWTLPLDSQCEWLNIQWFIQSFRGLRCCKVCIFHKVWILEGFQHVSSNGDEKIKIVNNLFSPCHVSEAILSALHAFSHSTSNDYIK